MTTAGLTYGIPDVELQRSEGGTVNPGCFAGHALVVLFLPTDPAAETNELNAYGEKACDLVANDAWLIAVHGDGERARSDREPKIAVAQDVKGDAWVAFEALAHPRLKLNRTEGATFFFGRGGTLQRVWAGAGHAADVTREFDQRCFDNDVGGDQSDAY